VGTLILFGWLIATAVLIAVLVLRYDPQAKTPTNQDRS
jgi:hypothetical protein